MVLDEAYGRAYMHYRMLRDEVRTEAFRKAIHRSVRPGDVVADLGAGTGILSLFACEAGAARVYAVERSPIIGEAREIARTNDLANRIKFVRGDATKVKLPERVDVLVSEWLGNFGLENLPALLTFRKNNLKRTGKVIPRTVALRLAPVETERWHRRVHFFGDDIYGYDMRSMRRLAANDQYYVSLRGKNLLALSRTVREIDARRGVPAIKKEMTAVFSVVRKGILHGLGGWFDAVLAPGVQISTSPVASKTHWHHLFLPIQEPISVQRGAVVRARLSSYPSGHDVFWKWRVEVFANRSRFRRKRPEAVFRHSSLRPG